MGPDPDPCFGPFIQLETLNGIQNMVQKWVRKWVREGVQKGDPDDLFLTTLSDAFER